MVLGRRAATLRAAPGCYPPMSRHMPRIALLVGLLWLGLAPAANAYAPFQMGIHDPGSADGAAGISRKAVTWRSVAPGGTSKPAGFDARNPADPSYNWAATDAFVRSA